MPWPGLCNSLLLCGFKRQALLLTRETSDGSDAPGHRGPLSCLKRGAEEEELFLIFLNHTRRSVGIEVGSRHSTPPPLQGYVADDGAYCIASSVEILKSVLDVCWRVSETHGKLQVE